MLLYIHTRAHTNTHHAVCAHIKFYKNFHNNSFILTLPACLLCIQRIGGYHNQVVTVNPRGEGPADTSPGSDDETPTDDPPLPVPPDKEEEDGVPHEGKKPFGRGTGKGSLQRDRQYGSRFTKMCEQCDAKVPQESFEMDLTDSHMI